MSASLPADFIERMNLLFPQINSSTWPALFTTKTRSYCVLNPWVAPTEATLAALTAAGIHWTAHPEIPKLGPYIISIETTEKSLLTHHPMHEAGHYYIMNWPSILTALQFDLTPNDRVLDLTAAPGGKTFLLALMMQNQGQITAIDQAKARFFKMKANFARLQVTNTLCLRQDGRRLAKREHNQYDHVLLDAPCSCESRFNLDQPQTLKYWHLNKIKACQSSQKQLILNAYRACKPGGRLVYSTCSFSPEENEAIIAYLIKKHPEARSIPTQFGQAHPGIASWGKASFPNGHYTLRIPPSLDQPGGCISCVSKPLETQDL
jgi:16S rRNA C967 or C1407 C5-methylase (RsmB/RsmF family)